MQKWALLGNPKKEKEKKCTGFSDGKKQLRVGQFFAAAATKAENNSQLEGVNHKKSTKKRAI